MCLQMKNELRRVVSRRGVEHWTSRCLKLWLLVAGERRARLIHVVVAFGRLATHKEHNYKHAQQTTAEHSAGQQGHHRDVQAGYDAFVDLVSTVGNELGGGGVERDRARNRCHWRVDVAVASRTITSTTSGR